MEVFDNSGRSIESSCSEFIDKENKKAYLDSPDFINVLEIIREFLVGNIINPNIKAYNMSNELFDLYDRNAVVFVPSTIYAYGTMGFFSKDTVFLQPPSLNGEYEPIYDTWLSFAINEKSKNKEEAWIFIKFMISKEMQVRTVYNSGDWSGQGRRIIPLTEEMLDAAGRLKSNTGRIMDYDDELSRIIFTEARSFFECEKSAEACAEAIQKKVEIYLNE